MACNVTDYVFSKISAWEDDIAQIDPVSGRKTRFRDVRRMATNTAQRLRSAGVEPGSVVALLSENCLQYVGVLLAVWRVGAIAALYPQASKSRELLHLLNTTKPRAIFATRPSEEQQLTLESLPQIQRLECTLDEMLQEDVAIDDTHQTPDTELALLLASSGTTGDPKNVQLYHSNILASVENLSPLLMEKTGVAVGVTPFCHAYGIGLLLMALCEGTTLVVVPKYFPDNFADIFSRYQVTHFHTVPTFLVRLADGSTEVGKLKTLRYLLTSGAMADPKTQEVALRVLGSGVRMYHAFGMTETTHVVTYGRVEVERPGSVGPVLPFVKAKIIGPAEEILDQGQEGELCVAGPTVMKGYYRNLAATRAAFTRDGWLRTGDLAYMDSDGYIFLIDRIKYIIKFQGYQVSCSEIEGVISRVAGVLDVAVVGVRHEAYGEVPKAFVVRKGEEVNEKMITEAVQKELSYYKWLRGGVLFVDSIPKSTLMKTMKRDLIKAK